MRVSTGLLALGLACAPAGPSETPREDAKVIDDDATRPSPSGSSERAAASPTWPTVAAKPPALARTSTERGRPAGDRSESFAAWTTSWVSIDPPAGADDGLLLGTVEAITPAPPPTAGGRPGKGSLRIVAADGTAVELPIAGPGRPALAVGDTVTAKWRFRVVRIHPVAEVGIVDRDGRLIYARSADGDPAYAPGWFVEQKDVAERGDPHMKGGARRESRWLLLARGDAAAFVRESEPARRLVTSEGEYAVSGAAITWTDVMLPPDAGQYSSFAIVRLPAAP
jgi:hypothetical protein